MSLHTFKLEYLDFLEIKLVIRSRDSFLIDMQTRNSHLRVMAYLESISGARRVRGRAIYQNLQDNA